MNRIYRSIWSHASATMVAVSEHAGSGSGRSAGALLAPSGFCLASLTPLAAVLALAYGSLASAALPTGASVAAGNAAVTVAGSKMTVTQASQNAVLNWQSFNIGAGNAVQFVQPNSAAVALNRVLGADPSSILGALSSNGKVFLVNPNGILFGKNAQVNANGLVASTLDIADSDFLAGRYRFAGASTAAVANQGAIHANGGFVALLGASVSNSGVISARLGTVALAAGQAVTLDVTGDGLLSVKLDAGALDALADNSGQIRADGGQVLLTAKAAGNLLQSAVNNSGQIEARTIDQRNGVIRLMGDMRSGTVNVGGRLDAGAPDGGDGGLIETSAAHVKVADGAAISTMAPQGSSGRWLIDPTDFTIGTDISGAALSSALTGGDVLIESNQGVNKAGAGNINVNEAVNWSANTLTLTAANNINLNAVVAVTGTGSVALNPATANGGAPAVASGAVLANLGAAGFNGRLDFAGSGSLVIGGNSHTVINSLADLRSMSGNLSGRYALGSDIDASATASALFAPIGGVVRSGYSATNKFAGAFNGLGHTISGLTVSLSLQNDVGMFGMTNGASIFNVGLVGGSTTGGYAVGSLVGYATNNTKIGNSYSSQAVQAIGQNVGGLVGSTNGSGSISNSYATGTVTANGSNRAWTGGLIGNNTYTVTDSYATGAVSATGTSGGTGGLIGQNMGSVSNSYATGSVNGAYRTGGLIGIGGWASSVSNSHASGTVAGSNDVGGLVGRIEGGSIANSYASGAISGQYGVGGLVGTNAGGTVRNSYFQSGSVTAISTMGGLSGDFGGTVVNSFYDIGSVTIHGGSPALLYPNAVTPHGIYSSQFADWLGNGKTLNVANYASTLMPVGGYYEIGGTQGLKDMLGFAESAGYKFRLNANIDLTPIPGWHIPVFSAAEFDGAGHTLDFLNVDLPTGWVGMIGNNARGSSVHGFRLTNASVSGLDTVGLLVGLNFGSVDDSSASGTVNSSSINVGGLIGTNEGGTVSGSSASATVAGINNVGALVGSNSGVITASHGSGSTSGNDAIGGLVGFNGGSIIASDATGTLTGHDNVGGLVGDNAGSISASHAGLPVTGHDSVGGLVGRNTGIIGTSYATGNVNGNERVGGLVGYNVKTVSAAYASGTVTGITDVGGLVGLNSGGAGGQGAYSYYDGDIGAPGADGKTASVVDSYARGAVRGTTNVGGLVGRNSGGVGGTGGDAEEGGVGGIGGSGGLALVSRSHASGPVSGSTAVGGLIGANTSGAVGGVGYDYYDGTPGAGGPGGIASAVDSYWDTTTSGQSASAAGTGFDTAHMTRKSTFAGFDFSTTPVWGFAAGGNSYPILCALSACGPAVTVVYIDPSRGTSVYGSAPLFGFSVVDANGAPLILNGASIADPSVAQYANAPGAASNVGLYGYNYLSGLSLVGSDAASYLLAAWATPAAWTVTPATLTATANNVSRVYGSATPPLSVSYAGFVNGENASALAVQASAASAAARNAGNYTISVAGALAANYVVRYVDGTLTVLAAPLSIKAVDALRLFGMPNPAFSSEYAGFQYDDTPASLGGTLRFDTAATAASPSGAYAIVPSGLSGNNYTIAYQDGALLVNAAAPSSSLPSLPGLDAAIGGAAHPLAAGGRVAMDPWASAPAAGAVPGDGLRGLNLTVAGIGIGLPPELDCSDTAGCKAAD